MERSQRAGRPVGLSSSPLYENKSESDALPAHFDYAPAHSPPQPPYALTFNDPVLLRGVQRKRLETKQHPIFLNVISTKQQSPLSASEGMYVNPDTCCRECMMCRKRCVMLEGERLCVSIHHVCVATCVCVCEGGKKPYVCISP